MPITKKEQLEYLRRVNREYQDLGWDKLEGEAGELMIKLMKGDLSEREMVVENLINYLMLKVLIYDKRVVSSMEPVEFAGNWETANAYSEALYSGVSLEEGLYGFCDRCSRRFKTGQRWGELAALINETFSLGKKAG